MVISATPLSIFLLHALLFFVTVSAEISPGSTFRASNPSNILTALNKTFSLAFTSISSATPSSYAAAITYSGVPVWKAGGDAGVVDSNATLQFQVNGNLRLVNGSGRVIWESGTGNRGVKTATLDDSGNLSLGNSSAVVWSSFENPTNTILPNQNFTVGKVLRSGSYSFHLQRSGNLVLKWNDKITYWNQGPSSTIVSKSLTSPRLTVQPIGVLSLSDPTIPNPAIMAYSSDYAEGSDILRFLRLDTDGNLRIYSSKKGSGTSTMRWSAISDQCKVFGWCGNMGICSYNGSKPTCGCPSQNFEFVDQKDTRKGCKRKVEIQDCPGNATMVELDQTLFLTYLPELSSQAFFVGISYCRLNCLVAGSCVAATALADGTGLCYFKVSEPFVSGYQSPAIPSTSFIKVCGPVVPNPPS